MLPVETHAESVLRVLEETGMRRERMLLLMDQARRLRRHARMLRATSERVRAASSKTRKKLSASRLPLYWP